MTKSILYSDDSLIFEINLIAEFELLLYFVFELPINLFFVCSRLVLEYLESECWIVVWLDQSFGEGFCGGKTVAVVLVGETIPFKFSTEIDCWHELVSLHFCLCDGIVANQELLDR